MYFKIITLTTCIDIVDIKPTNMEELTEVITAAEFHPIECNTFVYSSSKGTVRLCDMRQQALCDSHVKCKLLTTADANLPLEMQHIGLANSPVVKMFNTISCQIEATL